MTGAAGFFPWSFGGVEAKTPEAKTESVEQTVLEQDNGESDCPDAFELIALHCRWFGEDSTPAANMSAVNDAPGKPLEQTESVHEQGPAVYHIVKSNQDTAQGSRVPPPAQTQASRRTTISETLARAEQVLQQLPELPQHSRLQASLSALEAALAGTTLSDLEAALAGQEILAKREAS